MSFLTIPLSIVGWIYDPDHSFVVSAYVFLSQRKPAFTCAATTSSRLSKSRLDLASRFQALQDQHVPRIQPSQQLHELGAGRAPLGRRVDL